MDPLSLSRTTSADSVRSHASSHFLSAAASPTMTAANRKGRQVDVDTTLGETEYANLSMPPPSTKSNLRYHTHSRRSSRLSDGPWLLPPPSHSRPATDTPTFDAMADGERLSNSLDALGGMPVVPAGASESVTRSEPDLESHRMSFSSLYNPGRGALASGASSLGGGSDQDAKQEGIERTTTATHTLSVTTASQNGALSPSSLGTSSHDPFPASYQSSNTGSSVNSQTSPSTTSRQGRTIRGRPLVPARQGPTSNTASMSPSGDRSVSATGSAAMFKIGTIGICALDAKARSKPSRNILNRLVAKDNEFDVIIFGDKVILDEDVANWPVCDFLISFFSDGFPLEKAIAYAKLRKPFCVNDLPMQTVLWDRRMCLMILDKLGVPTPPRLEVNRDGGPVALSADIAKRMKQLTGVELIGSDDGRGGGQPAPYDVHMEDDDDVLVVDGKKLSKPFVEKPVSGEDHNINIYYPRSQGGGGRRLFRKVNNKSSEKDENLIVPKAVSENAESYIYEQFVKVENAEDVKAYTVGSDYCHAETRKSPVVDGVVKRNPNGKEIRYVTSLSKEEQIMAAKIASGFGQRVCGFDLLRVGDQSYVIDVNGWSFVKDNNDYYDKSAKVLRDLFVRERIRWDGRSTPTEPDEPEQKMLPPTSVPDKTLNIAKKPTMSKERDAALTGHHRASLKGVFRSRSISQLRDSVGHAAHRVSHPLVHGGGSTVAITSPPTLERSASFQKRSQTIPPDRDVLPTDIKRPQNIQIEHPEERHSIEHAEVSEPSEAPTQVPAPALKSQWKLKGMVAVIRHADRTPKQKFKYTFHTKPFVDLLKGHQEEVLLVGEAALLSVQHAVKQAMSEGIEDMAKLRQLSNALAKKGSWVGTKVQIKPMFKKPKDDKKKSEEVKEKKEKRASVPMVDATGPSGLKGTAKSAGEEVASSPPPKSFADEDDALGPAQHRAQARSDSVGEITMSRAAAADQNLVLDKLQLVMKWGGEPTHSARYQATDLGENMRNDLLLMNRDVLDDVSMFTSSERRVVTSAQIFGAAFLNQKELGDDQIHVRKDLLDDSNAAKDEMDRVKKKLKPLLRKGQQAPEQFAWPKDGTPEPYLVVRRVVELMKFHRRVMFHNLARLQSSDAVNSLEKFRTPAGPTNSDNTNLSSGLTSPPLESTPSSIQPRWCTGEDPELFKERWEKLFNEFTEAEKVDPSKISELYDTMKFDALHNRQFLEWVFTPSASFLAAEGDEERPDLYRTESGAARAKFQNTHDRSEAPAETPDLELDLAKQPPKRSGTAASSVLLPPDANGSNTQKPTISQRLGFRRKSADIMATARNAVDESNDLSQSYFNLFKGTLPAEHSKVKNDKRLEKLNEMYTLSKILFDFIGPQEYGITDAEKLEIGLLTSLPLLKEIVKDLEDMQASEHGKSFIYFTKESHIYTLLNCILEGGIQTKIARNAIPELDYLSQICFELYESSNSDDHDPSDPFNYSIRITLSPGCHVFDPLDVQLDSKHCIGCAPRRGLTPHGDWKEVLQTLRAKFHTVKLPKSFTAVNLSERHPGEFVQEGGSVESGSAEEETDGKKELGISGEQAHDAREVEG